MVQNQDVALFNAIRAAVLEAIDVIGIEGVRQMSMFPSSKWNNANDNVELPALRKAA